jgi:hypothetical protein
LNVVCHIGGGLHHAFPNHGEGFCPLNDVAIYLPTDDAYAGFTLGANPSIINLASGYVSIRSGAKGPNSATATAR